MDFSLRFDSSWMVEVERNNNIYANAVDFHRHNGPGRHNDLFD